MNLQQQAEAKVTAQPTSRLIDAFEMTDAAPTTAAIVMVRGWIMDELERRDSQAFERWIDDCEVDSPRGYFEV